MLLQICNQKYKDEHCLAYYTDNLYNNVFLAHNLQSRHLHLVGTLRSNRKYNPSEVVKAKLEKRDTGSL